MSKKQYFESHDSSKFGELRIRGVAKKKCQTISNIAKNLGHGTMSEFFRSEWIDKIIEHYPKDLHQ